MTTENKSKRANPDYSASAVNLINPLEVSVSLTLLKKLQNDLALIEADIKLLLPLELISRRNKLQTKITEQEQGLKIAIETFGSYQDVEAGMYAVKQRKVSLSYDASCFESHYPELSPAVLVKSVNVKSIEGLMKGGLLDKARLESEGVIKVSEAFVYIIKVPDKKDG